MDRDTKKILDEIGELVERLSAFKNKLDPVGEIETCPFCGGEAEVVPTERGKFGTYHVRCSTEGCCGRVLLPYQSRTTKSEAVEAWNTRKAKGEA